MTAFLLTNALLGLESVPRCQRDFGEIEESYLLVCHFYLPKEKSDIYIHSGSLAA
jgi:hypothetical protein